MEIPIYATEEWTWGDSLGDKIQSPANNDTAEELIKISDYNKIAKLYGLEQYELKDDEYMIVCNFDNMVGIRNLALQYKNTMTINGKEYHAKYTECKEGYVKMSTSHTNTGIILLPDSANLKEEWKEQYLLVANYNSRNDKEKEEIEKIFADNNSTLLQNLEKQRLVIDGMSKISLIESSVGLSTIIVFIAIYLGIIFLIASSAEELDSSRSACARLPLLRTAWGGKDIHSPHFRQSHQLFQSYCRYGPARPVEFPDMGAERQRHD